MDIVCPQCRTTYRIDETKIPTRSAKTRCKKCSSVIPIVIEQTAPAKKRLPSDPSAAARPTPEKPAPEPAPVTPTPASNPVKQTGARIGSAGRRFAAYSIDAIILSSFLWGLFFVFALVLPIAEYWQFAGSFILALIYFCLGNSTVFNGRTIGKRILGIRTQNGDGSAVSAARSALRTVLMIGPFFLALYILPLCELGNIFIIIAFVFLLSTLLFSFYLFLFNSGTRQSVHDLVMGTYVVAVGASGSVQRAPFWKWHAAAAGACLLLISLVVFLVFPIGGLS